MKHLKLTLSSSLLAAFVAASTLTFSPPVRADDEVVITEKARTHFRAGVALLQDPDGARYAEAYREFKMAYAESPSWKIAGNLGISAMKLERDGEAIQAFEIYLRDGGDQLDPAEKAQFQRDLDTLKAGVTWVTLSSTPPGATVSDLRVPLAGRPTENRYEALKEPLRIGLRPGQHKITVELEGYESLTWSFEAAGGEVSHVFELKKAEKPAQVAAGEPKVEKHRPVPTSVLVTGGISLALAAGGTVTGIMALGKKSDFNDATNRGDADAAKSDGETMNLMTDILLGSAIVAAGATAYLYFTRPEVEVDPTRDTGLRFAPTLLRNRDGAPSGGGLFVQGAF